MPSNTATYECQQIGDTFTLFDGTTRVVAEGARWVGGSEIKAVLAVFDGDVPVDSKALNLNQEGATRRFLARLKSEKNFTLADSALVTLEHYIRPRLPRRGDDAQSDEVEDSTSVVTTAELADDVRVLATDPHLLDRIAMGLRLAVGWAGDPGPPHFR